MIPNHFKQNIKNVLTKFVEEILVADYVEKVILYGSYSKNTYNSNSDIDIAVFIKKDSVSILHEFKRVTFLALGHNADIQPQIFYSDELIDPVGIVEEILEYGIELN